MGTTVSVKQLLKIVCNDSPWNYAFFWGLIEDGSSMSLSWGDGFWDYSKSHNKVSVSEKSMDFVSCLVHTYGQGIVGRVASTDTYSWILLDKFRSDENYLDTWHLHFGTEMKTILFVPVLPHGVVQLGSLDVILPDPMVVGDVKYLFDLLDNFHGALHFSHKFALTSYPYTYGEEFSTVSDKVLMDDASSSSAMPDMFPVYDFGIKPSVGMGSYAPEDDSQCLENVFGLPLCGDISMDLGIRDETIDIPISMLTIPDCEVNKLFNEFSSMPHLREVYPEKECRMDSSIFTQNSSSHRDVSEQPFNDIDADIMYTQDSGSPLSFDIETELQSAFESDNRLQDDMLIWEEKCFLSEVDGFFQPDISMTDSFFEGYVSGIPLVERLSISSAVNTDSSSEDGVSATITDGKKPTEALEEIDDENQMENACALNSSDIDSLTPLSHVEAEPICVVSEALSCPSDISEENVTLMINENEGAYKFNSGPSSSSKSPKLGRTAGKKGNVKRQRPRDRQMIQDRIKELREIIPDGEKCSIDALLERAANHMHFLRSVTRQAEKMSKCTQSKEVLSTRLNKKSKTSPTDSNQGNFAERSQPEFSPIVVENLDQPEHILVEVLCKEQSLFLEIAQVIRRLKLTILEGVLETRTEHRWASFIIETPRGFQQVEVVWALMQLLQTRRVIC